MEPDLNLTTGMGGDGNDTSSEDGSSSSLGVIIGAAVVGSLLAVGVVAFLVVLFLIIRHKRKTNKYTASGMMPSRMLYNQNGYVSLVFI